MHEVNDKRSEGMGQRVHQQLIKENGYSTQTHYVCVLEGVCRKVPTPILCP